MANSQNITSILERWIKQVEQHPDWKPSLEDVVYMIHGSGSDRDRLYTMRQAENLLMEMGVNKKRAASYGIIPP